MTAGTMNNIKRQPTLKCCYNCDHFEISSHCPDTDKACDNSWGPRSTPYFNCCSDKNYAEYTELELSDCARKIKESGYWNPNLNPAAICNDWEQIKKSEGE